MTRGDQPPLLVVPPYYCKYVHRSNTEKLESVSFVFFRRGWLVGEKLFLFPLCVLWLQKRRKRGRKRKVATKHSSLVRFFLEREVTDFFLFVRSLFLSFCIRSIVVVVVACCFLGEISYHK